MSSFEPNAIIRGAQLTVVGAYRALQNPALFKSEHYRQAALAVCAGIAIRLVLSIPIVSIKCLIWILSWFIDLHAATWDDKVIEGLEFVATYVLQLPFLLMTLMRYITPTLDELFMESLRWVDTTYAQKHRSEDVRMLRALYYPNLRMYSTNGDPSRFKQLGSSCKTFLARYGRKTMTYLAVYLLSLLPLIGRFVLPAASFYTFKQSVGIAPAIAIFGSGLIVPKRFLAIFLRSYFASRSLMRELLEPYFCRIKFSRDQKRLWFQDRQGVLFGFAVGFYIMLQTPLFGVFLYGVAEASAAYLITKITDPPPPPAYSEGFAESQVRWTNKREFVKLPLGLLDQHNIRAVNAEVLGQVREKKPPRREFS